MKKTCSARSLMAALTITGSLIGGANAGLISNGSLSVTIDDNNGAIDTAEFLGTDYFNPGAPVSDFGFQSGSDTGSFVLNTTTGVEGQPVTVLAGSVVSGLYAPLNIGFTRVYEIVGGQNVLKITTTLNNDGVAATLRYFDTFDPDQGTGIGASNSTINDVFDIVAGVSVGRASVTGVGGSRSVTIGSLDSEAVIASGGPFQINNGSLLNSFFSSPFDGEGANTDQGTHIGYEYSFAANESKTFTTYVAFGETAADSDAAFVAATGVAAVPEPSSTALLGLGGLALALRRRR